MHKLVKSNRLRITGFSIECEVGYLSRDILVHSSGHCGTTDPDQNQDRQNESGGQDPARQPRVSTSTKVTFLYVQQYQ